VYAEVAMHVERLEVRQVLSNMQMAIDILVPPKFREGDVFAITAMTGIPGEMITVQVIGDNNAVQYQFPSSRIDGNGNATLALRMPYVLTSGFTVDGRTLRVTTDSYRNDLPVTLNSGQRVSLSTDNIREGQNITVTVKDSIAKSTVIMQLVQDNAEVVHEWAFAQTNSSGNGSYKIAIPSVVPPGHTSGSYGFRVISGGIVTDQKITIAAGVQVEVGATTVQENNSIFPVRVNGANPNVTVTLKWYWGLNQRGTSQSFRVGSTGAGSFQATTPTRLITNSATSDVFRLVVSVSGQSTPITFFMIVYKYSQPSPTLGSSQFLTFAPMSIHTNSARGIAFHTPAVFGVKSVLPISRVENLDLGQKDPATLIQDWMKHQLVLLCYGSGQHPGDNVGMDMAFERMRGITGEEHVLRLFSGDRSANPGQNPANALAASVDATRLIASKMSLLASLGQNIASVVIVGYSWGGGMAKDLANWIKRTYSSVEVSGLMYVDAVRHGLIGHELSLPRSRPSSFMNVYQDLEWDLSDIVVLGSGRIPNYGLPLFNGSVLYGRYLDFDTDFGGVNRTSHVSIDEWAASPIAEFVDAVICGWFGKHPS
jgi:hypothetical protein